MVDQPGNLVVNPQVRGKTFEILQGYPAIAALDFLSNYRLIQAVPDPIAEKRIVHKRWVPEKTVSVGTAVGFSNFEAFS